MLSRIPFIRPRLPSSEELASDLAAIEESNWYSNFGPFEQRFRKDISEYLGLESSRIVTANNATTGLMGAVAISLPRGDLSGSIAIASFTFAAGAQAILWHGYRPAWLDIDRSTLQPSIASLDALIEKTQLSAILLTNTFGIANPEMRLWEERALDLGIPLIVDSAAGFGSRYPDMSLLGAAGDFEVFSFHATKPFAIGEGGAVVCRNSDDAERLRNFTNFAFSGQSGATSIGLNGKLQELNAAIGLRQFETFEQSLISRHRVLRAYAQAFEELPLDIPDGLEVSAASFAPVICWAPDDATRVLSSLKEASVDARNYYAPALHTQPGFASFEADVSLENTVSQGARGVSLPVLPDMTDSEINHVIKVVTRALTP